MRVGIIAWESITHEKPYHDSRFPVKNYKKAVEEYVVNGGREEIPKLGAPAAWWELTERCWHQDPEKRPSAAEALKELRVIRAEHRASQSSSSASSSSSAGPSSSFSNPSHSSARMLARPNRLGMIDLESEFVLDEAAEEGDGFYNAVILQLQRTHRAFLTNLTVKEGSTVEKTLRTIIEGVPAEAEENPDKELLYYLLAERTNSIVAVIDTRNPQLGFCCYFSDSNGERKRSYNVSEVPMSRPIIRFAYTGEHFQSVKEHPDLSVGGLRMGFHGEVWGGYSLHSSSTRLSSSRLAFTTEMNSSRNSSVGTAHSLQARPLSTSKAKEKEKEEVRRSVRTFGNR